MAAAMASSIWNSITRSTFSRISSSAFRRAVLRVAPVVEDDELDVLVLGGPDQAVLHVSWNELSWPSAA